MNWLKKLLTAFSYDAVTGTGKRKQSTGLLQSEEAELKQEERRKLIADTRDIRRNFAIAAWMIRRHLDYVSTFSFQATTGNDDLDDAMESDVAEWSKPENCDAAGRHSLPRIIRLSEAHRVIDGDCGLMKLIDGRLQGIEGDRIRNPPGGVPGYQANVFKHGVQTNEAGKALAYAICKRGDSANSFVFERVVPANNIYLHAGYERFDQVRGVTPLSAALNTLKDTYEGFEYALAKLKVSQLFGLCIYREGSEPLGNVTEDEDLSTYEVDFGRGPVKLELDPGDRAEFLESKSPSTEFQSFTETMIGVALKSLDIPYSFYSENFTNYSGQRQAWVQYEQSADLKRVDVKTMLDYLTAWHFMLAVQDGKLPGASLDKLRWTWIPRGLPWIDLLKEIQAESLAIGAGLDNPEDICQRHGKNVYDNIDKTARVLEYAAVKGVKLTFGSAIKEEEGNERNNDQQSSDKFSALSVAC